MSRVNVRFEKELYRPMANWLNLYLSSKYVGWEITTMITDNTYLDIALRSQNITLDSAIGLGIQIDVLGIAKRDNEYKLFFIEAKKTPLSIRDYGQLLGYCRLINPEEAFLFSSIEWGGVGTMVKVLGRGDILTYGEGKSMVVGIWDVPSQRPDFMEVYPSIQTHL